MLGSLLPPEGLDYAPPEGKPSSTQETDEEAARPPLDTFPSSGPAAERLAGLRTPLAAAQLPRPSCRGLCPSPRLSLARGEAPPQPALPGAPFHQLRDPLTWLPWPLRPIPGPWQPVLSLGLCLVTWPRHSEWPFWRRFWSSLSC